MVLQPLPTHFNIVVLQGEYIPSLDFTLPPPLTCSTTTYPNTTPDKVRERVRDAHIVVTSFNRFTAEELSLEVTPKLRMIAMIAVGTDVIDLDACRKRGIIVSNSPYANVEAVSEHAIGLYFATRRSMVHLHSLTCSGAWMKTGGLFRHMLSPENQLPLTCADETVGIIGFGAIGNRIAKLARNLGMNVLISGRKDVGATNHHSNEASSSVSSLPTQDEERTPFEEILSKSTVIFIAVPRCPETINYISTPEFELMSSQTLLVNVSRGEIVNEDALLEVLKERRIAGAATDVFKEEPAGPENSPLLQAIDNSLNLIVSPHLAWFSKTTTKNQLRIARENITGFCTGKPCNVVV